MITKILLLATAMTVGGCATMFHSSMVHVNVSSEDKTAKLYLGQRYLGKGNASVSISKSLMESGSHTLLARRKGCDDGWVPLQFRPTIGWFIFGNCIFNGCMGIFVDVLTGAYRELLQHNYEIEPDCG